MSSKSSEKQTEPRGKAKDDATRCKKLRKTLLFLFTQNGLKERSIPHEKDDEVAVDDILASEHFSKQLFAEDFEHAVAKDSHDLILKEEPHFLLVTSNGRKVVKYYKEPLEYKESANAVQLNDGANVDLNKEPVAAEKVINDAEPEKHEENDEQEQRNEPATGGGKKKKNKKNKTGPGGSQGGTNKNQSKKEDEESPVPNVPVVKEATASAESETKAEMVSRDNSKHQSDPTDSSPKSHPSKETIAESESAKPASENKDEVLKDNSEIDSDEGFTPAVGKKSSKKSPKKKGKQSEASAIKNSGNESKQNKDGKQAAESPGKAGKQTEGPVDKAGKQTEKSPGKQTKEQKPNESKQKNSDKQNAKSENVQKKVTDDVNRCNSNNSVGLSSDEEKTSVSPEGPPKKKLKKPEDRLKKIPNTFKFLFGEKDGLKDKQIPVGDGGFVKVKSIIDVYQTQYQWTEKEITEALGNNEDYEFKRDDADGLLVKTTAKKSQAVDQAVEVEEPGNDDSWQASGRRKEGQDDRKQRPLQSSAASRSPGVGAVPPDKLRSTLFWVLGRDGAAKHSIQFQPGKCLYVDEIINKVPNLYQVSVSEIRAAAEADPRKQFIFEEIKGQTTVRLQENRTPRDRNTDFAGRGDTHLSKTMSFILRHGAEKLQLTVQPDGFMFVDELLSHKDFRSYTEEDVKRVVRDNDKQRFLIAEDPQTGRLKVRANQGHTFVVPDLELQPITTPNDVPTVVHGTYHDSWKVIQKQGLSRMTRNHIHFAAGEPGSDGVISGMRNSCDVLIFIDMQTALNDGVKFFRSANNVILSPGDDKGIVAPKYFKTVVQRSPRMKLL